MRGQTQAPRTQGHDNPPRGEVLHEVGIPAGTPPCKDDQSRARTGVRVTHHLEPCFAAQPLRGQRRQGAAVLRNGIDANRFNEPQRADQCGESEGIEPTPAAYRCAWGCQVTGPRSGWSALCTACAPTNVGRMRSRASGATYSAPTPKPGHQPLIPMRRQRRNACGSHIQPCRAPTACMASTTSSTSCAAQRCPRASRSIRYPVSHLIAL